MWDCALGFPFTAQATGQQGPHCSIRSRALTSFWMPFAVLLFIAPASSWRGRIWHTPSPTLISRKSSGANVEASRTLTGRLCTKSQEHLCSLRTQSTCQSEAWGHLTPRPEARARSSPCPCQPTLPGDQGLGCRDDRGFLSHSCLQRGSSRASLATEILHLKTMWQDQKAGMHARPERDEHMPVSCPRPSSQGSLIVGSRTAAPSKFLFLKGLSLKVKERLHRRSLGEG